VTKYYGGNALKKNGNLQYLLKDHLGSVVGSLDANTGVIESQRAYKPFGDDLLMRGTIPTTLGYTGQRQEPELGLYYYNARWYDPYLGRFTQPDTIVPNPTDAKAFDRYAYVNNNPVMYSDPSGHRSCRNRDGIEMLTGKFGDADCWHLGGQIFSNPNDGLSLSDAGLEFIKQFEIAKYGEPDVPTLDPVGICTFGYGHAAKTDDEQKYCDSSTAPDGSDWETYVALHADEWLRTDIVSAESEVKAHITADLSQNQYDALVSLAYNQGGNAFVIDGEDTDLKTELNAGNYEVAAHLFHSQAFGVDDQRYLGLLIRRDFEARLFYYGIYTKGYLDISRDNYKFFVPAISLGNYRDYKKNHPGTTLQEYVNLGWTLYKTAKSYCRLQNNQYPCN
jgi:RHS repeat-associated protein